MKHLPKHLTERWRYLAVEVTAWPGTSLSRGAFQRELWFAAQNLLGDVGSADADLTVFGFEGAAGEYETIVRARRGEVGPARAALACIDAVGDDPVGVYVRGVSGTVRACEESYLGRATGATEQRHVAFDGVDRPAHVRDDAIDVSLPDGHVGAAELDFE